MRSMSSLPWFAVAAAIVMLSSAMTSCAAKHEPARPTPSEDPLVKLVGNWTAIELDGAPVTGVPDARGKPSLAVGANGRVSGFAGVNRFTGTLDLKALEQGRFATSPLATTRMAGPPESMQLEQRFLLAMSRADACRADDTSLSLSSGPTVVARFTRAP